MQPSFSVKAPKECTEAALHQYSQLLLAGGEVVAEGVLERIGRAKLLAFLSLSEVLVGIAGIKQPDSQYRNRIFKKALSAADLSEYRLELGWVYLSPEFRGQGLAKRLVHTALSASLDSNLFATTRADNKPMISLLRSAHFSEHGEAYSSVRGDYKILLFTRQGTNDAS